MFINYFQKGFNFSQDGPGNRLVFHLQGCNMRCPWCSNPEGLLPDGTLMTEARVKPEYCVKNAFTDGRLDRSRCAECTKPCLRIPASGVRLSCKKEEIDRLVSYCMTCTPMFFDGGGVTLTGGEVTVQFDAVREFLTKLKEKGIHTCIESNATHRKLPELFSLVDFLIVDCKHYDSDALLRTCGTSLEGIAENIRRACRERDQLLIRIPLIGGFNASEEDAERFAGFFSRIGTDICTFEFLRYHEYGKGKYEKCGMEYTMTEEAKVSPETVTLFREIFNSYKLRTIHT